MPSHTRCFPISPSPLFPSPPRPVSPLQESDLQSTIQKHKEDAKTLDAWTGFLEDSWKMQLLAQEAKDTQLK